MSDAIWFSRHHPTDAQIEDAKKIGFRIIEIDQGKKFGSLDLRDVEYTQAVVKDLINFVVESEADAIFGVASTPIQAMLYQTAGGAVRRGRFRIWVRMPGKYLDIDVPFYSSWNVSRSVVGGKLTFDHLAWVLVGRLSTSEVDIIQRNRDLDFVHQPGYFEGK